MCLSEKWLGFFLQKKGILIFFLDAFIRVRKKVKCVTLWGLYEAFVCLVGVLLCRIHSFVCRVVHTTFQHFFVCPKKWQGVFCEKRGFLVLSSSIHSSSQIGENELNFRPLCVFEDFYLVEFIHSLLSILCVKWKKK